MRLNFLIEQRTILIFPVEVMTIEKTEGGTYKIQQTILEKLLRFKERMSSTMVRTTIILQL